MKKLTIPAVLLAVLVLLTTCSEPIDFLDEVTTEVKIANDLFLEVESVSPVDNTANVNPAGDIEIQFDRPISMSSANDVTIKILDPGDTEIVWRNPRFNTTTNTLSIEPFPYLGDSTKYSVVVSGVKGTDGSDLIEEKVWSFTTGIYPAGSITVSSNNPDSIVETTIDGDIVYTDSTTVSYEVEGNTILNVSNGEFFVSNSDLNGLSTGELESLSWVDYTVVGNRIDNSYPISAGDGPKTIYAIFRYYNVTSSAFVYSRVEEASIELDTISPSVNLTTDTLYKNSEFYVKPLSLSDGYSYAWSGTGLDFSSPSYYATDIVPFDATASGEGAYTATLLVKDKAGNPASDSISLVWDITPPTVSSAKLGTTTGYEISTSTSVPFSFSISDNFSNVTNCEYYIYNTDTGSSAYTSVPSATVSVTLTFNSHNYSYEYARVYARDQAGNVRNTFVSGVTYDYTYIDSLPVQPPSVSFTDGTTTIGDGTLDTTPTWTWSSGGNGKSSPYYRYDYYPDDGGLYLLTWDYTSSTSFTPSALSNGAYILIAQEQDYDGSWSATGSQRVVVSSFLPYDGQTGVTRSPLFDWPSEYLVTYNIGVESYNLITKKWVEEGAFTGLTSSSLQWNTRDPLPANTLIRWGYQVVSKGGTVVYGPYTFRTRY
jgi:Bacterial Ig-like domain